VALQRPSRALADTCRVTDPLAFACQERQSAYRTERAFCSLLIGGRSHDCSERRKFDSSCA